MDREEEKQKLLRMQRNMRLLSAQTMKLVKLFYHVRKSGNSALLGDLAGELAHNVQKMEQLLAAFEAFDKVYLAREKRYLQKKLRQQTVN